MKGGCHGSPRLSLALFVHSDKLLFAHILMLYFHFYCCLSLAYLPLIFPFSLIFIKVYLLVWQQYFASLYVISFIDSLFFVSLSRTFIFDCFCVHEIRAILLYMHTLAQPQFNFLVGILSDVHTSRASIQLSYGDTLRWMVGIRFVLEQSKMAD